MPWSAFIDEVAELLANEARVPPHKLNTTAPGGAGPAAPHDIGYLRALYEAEDFDRLIETVRTSKALLDQPEPAFLLGCALQRTGRATEAEYAFYRSLHTDPRIWQHAKANSAAEKIAALQSFSVYGPRLANILRDCAVYGHCTDTLDPDQERLIEHILMARRAAWHEGRTPPPPHVSAYDRGKRLPERALAGLKVLLVCCPRVRLGVTQVAVESELYHHYTHSARNAGIAVDFFDATEMIAYPDSPSGRFQETLTALERVVLAGDYDVIVFEGNFTPAEYTVTPAFWQALKDKKRFFLVSFTTDCYNATSPIEPWGPVSDVMTVGDISNGNYWATDLKRKMLYSPSLPFHEADFEGVPTKDIDLGFIGSRPSFVLRARNLYYYAAEACGIDTRLLIHSRLAEDSAGTRDYATFLQRLKLTFNNGFVWYIPGEKCIITGRIAESILSRCLLLQETGSPIDDFFVPYVHYIPVANIHQFVAFSQFMLKHEEVRHRIVEDARSFHQTHYSSSLFWRELLARAREARG